MALQHLRSNTANKRPLTAGMSDGQLAMNTNTASPGLFFKDSTGALVKVGPVHVGTTAPNASPAIGGGTGNTIGEQWLDTTGGTYVFKVWDGSAWRSETGTFVDVNGDVMTGALGIIAGSESAPGLYVSGDTNTGLYSPGADQLALSTAGSGRLFIGADGKVGVGVTPVELLTVNGNAVVGGSPAARYSTMTVAGDFAIQSAAPLFNFVNAAGSARFGYINHTGTGGDLYLLNQEAGSLRFGTDNGERARIDSSGRLLVGTSTALASAFGTVSPRLQIATTTSGPVSFFSYANDAFAARLDLSKSRGTTVGTNTVVADGDDLGDIYFNGADGTNFIPAALIRGEVDGTPGTNDMPGRLVFSTTANGASSPTERMRITSDGRLLVGTSSSVALLGYDSGAQFAASTGTVSLIRNTTDNGATELVHAKSRGTISAPTIVSDGDGLSLQRFAGYDGAAYIEAARIVAAVDGTPGLNDMPGRLVFSTTADGASSTTERMRINSAGTTTLTSAASTAPFIANISTSEVARIDSSGRLLVGTSTVYGISGLANPDVQLSKANQDSTLAVTAWKGDGLTFNPTLQLMRSYNNTAGTHTAVPDGARLGSIRFAGSDGTGFSSGAEIVASADGQTWATGDCPGRLIFGTTADGASAPTERLRISSTGAFGLSGANYGTSGQVLTSNGSGAAPTWQTPAASGATLSGNNAFTGANTFYNSTGQTFGTGTSTQDGVVIAGRAGGTTSLRVTLQPGALSASRTLTLPDTTGTVITSGDTGSVTNTMLAGSIADSKLSTISTSGKVSGTAITSGNISTSGSIATTSTLAVGQSSAAANTDFDLNGTYAQTIVAVPALNIDCSTGNYFTKTINGASTFTVSSVPASRSYSFTLELTHTSGAITWFSGVEWPGATAPTLTTGKTHLFMFVTDDGGTRWRASSLINYTN
jgi:hypothetical protein